MRKFRFDFEGFLMRFRCYELAIPVTVFIATTCVVVSAYAQTIKTPMGELRTGMSEDEALRILQMP
jgi:large-conductance mechanosensitive channel